MLHLLDNTIQTVKRISTDLRPGLLDDIGLTAAIDWQVQEFQNRTGIKCSVSFSPADISVDRERSTAVFRVLQETLTNVARHANATRVQVNLKQESRKLTMKVKDNGKGITKKQISDPKSLGLIGIGERIDFLGGEVNITGARGKGTTVTVTVPVGKRESS
jgi:signal transduction histidine kinase